MQGATKVLARAGQARSLGWSSGRLELGEEEKGGGTSAHKAQEGKARAYSTRCQRWAAGSPDSGGACKL